MNKIIKAKRLAGFFLTITALGMVFFIVYYTFPPASGATLSTGGRADLSGYNFAKNKIACLNGEWDFYPGKLLSPEEIPGEEAYFVKVPGSWSKKGAYSQSARGVGTYHISVKLPETSGGLMLRVENVWTSHRVYINGRLASRMGGMSDSAEGYWPKNIPYLIPLDGGGDLDIVIQAANFTYYYCGGIMGLVQIGSTDALEMRSNLFFGMDLVWIYLFLMFGIYHLNMHQMRENEMTSLYSGAALVLMSAAMGFGGEKVLARIFSWLPPEIPYKIQDVTSGLAFVLMLLFIDSFAQGLFKKRTFRHLMIPCIAYLAFIFMPGCAYTAAKPFFGAYCGALLGSVFFRITKTMLRNKNNRELYGEISCVAGAIACVFIILIGSALFYYGAGAAEISVRAAILGLILFVNLFSARRFSNKMDEVEELTEKLQKSTRIKNEFMERISYQLVEPLAEMSGISGELLSGEEPLTPRQRENMHMLKDMSGRLSLLVNDLIDAIRLRYDDMDLQIKAVDIRVVTDMVFRLLSYNAEGRGIKLINRVSPMTFAEADENRLVQIIYNLAENALSGTYRGEITADASVSGDKVLFVLTDTGRGLPGERWEAVFGAGAGHHAELSEGNAGLYLSRQIARMMKGDIWISRSAPGAGTEVSLWLPRGEPGPGRAVAAPEAAEGGPARGDEDGAKKLLIVDDELKNIDIFNLALGKKYRVYTAYQGIDALTVLQNQSVDLVITDMVMPGMSGVELIRRIRQTYSMLDLPVIMTSSGSGWKEIEMAFNAGANDYLAKPFTIQEIRLRVRTMLELSDAMEAAVQNEIAFAQAQIKPHFIYNAISNIIALCYDDGAKAAAALSMLARYLRYILLAGEAGRTATLMQELEIIKVYVEIEKLRFGERLSYETHIAEGIAEDELMIPLLLIQPLVENSIRHGLFDKVGQGVVRLTVSEKDYFILIVVEDNGAGMEKEKVEKLMSGEYGEGVGIRNIRKRAEALRKGAFWIESVPGAGTRISILLPKKLLKPKEV